MKVLICAAIFLFTCLAGISQNTNEIYIVRRLSHNTIIIPDNVHNTIFIIKTKDNKAVELTETTYEALVPVVK